MSGDGGKGGDGGDGGDGGGKGGDGDDGGCSGGEGGGSGDGGGGNNPRTLFIRWPDARYISALVSPRDHMISSAIAKSELWLP